MHRGFNIISTKLLSRCVGDAGPATMGTGTLLEKIWDLIKGSGEDINKCNQGRGFVSENVVDLSNRELTIEEIKVLSRGLNFCPTPNSIDKFQLKKDIDEFGRRLKLKYYFN